MWLYMVSFVIEAPADTRRRRLPYIFASLVIFLLFTTSKIITVVTVYNVLLKTIPGTNMNTASAFWSRAVEESGALWVVAGLTVDWSFRLADLVLVRLKTPLLRTAY